MGQQRRWGPGCPAPLRDTQEGLVATELGDTPRGARFM